MKGENKMKAFKRLIIILTIAFGLWVCFFIAYVTNQRTVEAEVIERHNNTITLKDTTNNLWEYKTDDYKVNDKVILTFNDKGTDFLTDDEIIKIERVGE